MKSDFTKEIIFYPNILDSNSGIHGWKPKELFDISKITEKERETLSSIVALEQIFKGVGDKRELFDSLFKWFDSFLNIFLFSSDTTAYLLHIEHKKQIKNRVRSHKGILPKEIDKKDYIQIEVPVINDYTIIVALIKLTKENIDICLPLFSGSQTSCIIISSREEFFMELFLKSIAIEMITCEGINFINYTKLITECCSKGDIICRMGGDGGNTEISLQIFCQKHKKDLMILQVEGVLNKRI